MLNNLCFLKVSTKKCRATVAVITLLEISVVQQSDTVAKEVL